MEGDSLQRVDKVGIKQGLDSEEASRGIGGLIRHPVVAPVIAALIVNIILRVISYLFNIDLKGF